MPIYEYRCGSCGSTFERLTRVDASVPACPSCGRTETRRLLSLIAAPIRAETPTVACGEGACADGNVSCGGGACARLN